MTPHQRLVELARSFVGVHEAGHNKGAQVEAFQKAVDGRAQQEPWCMAFVQYCIMQVEKEFGIKTNLPRTEHVRTAWNKCSSEHKGDKCEEGYIALYGKEDSTSGHTGIVTEKWYNNVFTCVEGNTNMAGSREGDGVYEKKRKRKHGNLILLGFIDPF